MRFFFIPHEKGYVILCNSSKIEGNEMTEGESTGTCHLTPEGNVCIGRPTKEVRVFYKSFFFFNYLLYFFFYFICLFIFGCVGSSFLCEGFL